MHVCCAHFHGLLWSILQLLGFMFILTAKGSGPWLGGSAASAVCFAALFGKVWQSSASSWAIVRAAVHVLHMSNMLLGPIQSS